MGGCKKGSMERRELHDGEQQELDKRLDALREFTNAITGLDKRITEKDKPKKMISETAY
jgi:hypothetical protein